MYCVIKYIDYKNSRQNDASKKHSGIALENKELLFNPDCFIKIIQDYVFEKVGIPTKLQDRFDIVTEKGKILKINNYPPNFMGLDIFTEKLTYYIMYYNDENQIKPLLSEASKEMAEFESYQRRRSSQSNKRRHSANKSSQGSVISNEVRVSINTTSN